MVGKVYNMCGQVVTDATGSRRWARARSRRMPTVVAGRTLAALALLTVLALVTAMASCTSSGDTSAVVVYSGRSKELVEPLFEAFTEATGTRVEARYAGSAELALLIDAEGVDSPADVFISQSPGAMGYLHGSDRLRPLGEAVVNRVPPGFRSADGTWVGLTGRVRTLVYNSALVDSGELPRSVFDLTAPAFAGRVAVAPANGSFQDFITAMRHEVGDDTTSAWLAGMGANESPNYPKNSAIVEAVGRGEVDMGLVNHYYNLRALEADPSVRSVNHFFPSSDVGSLALVTAGAVLDTADDPAAGESLLEFLLDEAQQRRFAQETQEYPLALGVPGPVGLPPLEAFVVNTIDYEHLGDELQGTVRLIRNSGIER